ncbi:endonuclease/exonuclease/phosphatase family protein [Leptospira stimsonii]|uniref:Endonuclease n=1 Tax=Leptospira stimsonii TaxID=2202203 RepID=A0A396Z0N4_9LEPT|nr:endonuclease/exonuclease/phosphatase family protein [Leptospira stimsonii]RHX87204.1 endonuclease [Leptospira stimsonii]
MLEKFNTMQKEKISFSPGILMRILIFFGFLSGLLPSLSAQETKLKIVSYNAMFLYDEVGDENKFPKGRIPRKESDFEKIKAHLSKIDPDILAVQEVENETAVLKILPNSYLCSVTKTPGYQQEVGICWKKKFVSHEILLYPELSLEPGARSGIELKVSIGKRKYSFLNVHLKAGHSGKDRNLRFRQLKTLNEILKGKKNYFLLGDMNVPLGKDKKSWKLLSEDLDLKNPGRYTKQTCWGHKSLIDFILTDLPFENARFSQIPFPEDDGDFDGIPESEKRLSDHCPVALEIGLE